MTRPTLAVAALLTFSMFSARANAQPADVDAARRHADDGQAAFEAGDFQRAYDEYSAAYELFPNSLLLVNVARAAGRLGHNAEAIAKLRQVLLDATLEAARRSEVEGEVARLRGQVVELTIAVTPAGSEIRVNGNAAGTAPLESPIVLDPGQITVEATHEGHEMGRWVGSLSAGTHRSVALALSPTEESTGAEGEGEVTPPPPPPRPAGHRPTALLWVTGVGAGVLGAVSLTMGAITASRDSDWDSETDAFKEENKGGYKTFGAIADVLGGLAIVSGGIFIYLLATSGDAEEAAATALAEPGILHF